MNTVIENYIEWIELLENSIFSPECPSEFENDFCEGNELLELWFSSMEIKITYLTSAGNVIPKVIPITELSDWLDKE
ncbi:hypothetical protein M0R04_05025 [Candidatus Dojkabacteria bacterium]|jgi:hypothetical protein|nr:hypothetical protein [Candidatus Dojkabacteria bacterium]